MIAAKRDLKPCPIPTPQGPFDESAATCRYAARPFSIKPLSREHRKRSAASTRQSSLSAKANCPKRPSAGFGTVPDHEVMAFLPQEVADRAFDLGRRYQRVEIDAKQAIDYMQALADELCTTLQVDPPFEALRFLRDEIAEEEGDGTEEEGWN